MYELGTIGQGKIYLPRKLREKYFKKGEKEEYYVLDLPGEIVFIPKPSNPLADLRRLFSHEKRSPAQIKKDIRKMMENEMGRN